MYVFHLIQNVKNIEFIYKHFNALPEIMVIMRAHRFITEDIDNEANTSFTDFINLLT